MAGANNTITTTYGGSTFNPSGYGYPAVPYAYDDFHHANDGWCADDDAVIDDWNNTSEVQNCMLLSLSDLKTQSATVRTKIAAYLNDLIGLGVDGFRVDAAKHVAQPTSPRSGRSSTRPRRRAGRRTSLRRSSPAPRTRI